MCDAVDYAHQNLVVHRDLTPRNILVADGSVRLLDFGISKLLDASDGGVTAGGLVPFTPDCGSPEQVRGETVTTRTDVYALGLVLFEILTGVRAQQVDTSSLAALERAICETPVPAPSASALSLGDRGLARRLRGDLDTIVLTAADKEPARRYVSAGQTVDALEAMEHAIETGEAALVRHPSDIAILEAIIEARGTLLAAFESSPAAFGSVPRYLELAERLNHERPGAATSKAALGVAYSQAGKVAASAEHLDEARAYYRRNAELQGEIVAADPYNATARRNLMLAWGTLTDLALGPLGQTSYTGAGGPAVAIDARQREDALDAATRTIEQAERLRDQDPQNATATFDYAIALGRSAPAFPPGDERAIAALEQSLALLRTLEATNATRTRPFLIELGGSLAERQRQAGRMDHPI